MKSLEERIADRKKRKEEAAAEAKKNGTGQVQADDGDGGEGDEYTDYTVAELKAELDKRKISYASGSVKADLIKALEADDNK